MLSFWLVYTFQARCSYHNELITTSGKMCKFSSMLESTDVHFLLLILIVSTRWVTRHCWGKVIPTPHCSPPLCPPSPSPSAALPPPNVMDRQTYGQTFLFYIYRLSVGFQIYHSNTRKGLSMVIRHLGHVPVHFLEKSLMAVWPKASQRHEMFSQI